MQLDYRVQTPATNRGTDLTTGPTTPSQQIRTKLVDEFRQRFDAMPRLFRAPGRVNLIGEHTDYNQGLVMPAAIGMGVWAAVAPRTDRKIVVCSRQFVEPFEFELDETAEKRGLWTDYVQGVVISLRDAGFPLQGASILIHGEVPFGAGLSSSAALEIATAFALTQIAGQSVDPVELAKLCQKAENEFVGAHCGIMDQFICSLGERAHCLLIDCRSLEYSNLRLPDDICLVVCNTMVKLGTGQGFSVREVIATARKITGHSIPDIECARRPGDPAVLIASAEKIKCELGWKPMHSELAEIIESAWAWMKAHPAGYPAEDHEPQPCQS